LIFFQKLVAFIKPKGLKQKSGMLANVKEPAQLFRIEPRWPVILAIIAVLFLLTILPRPIAMLPVWIPCVAGIVVIVPMAVVGLTAAKARWLRIERNTQMA